LLAAYRFSTFERDREEGTNPDRLHGCASAGTNPVVEISPPDIVQRRLMTWRGMAAESVQCTSQDKVRSRFRAPMHLLLAYEEGARRGGETFVEGLPRSTRRNFARRLTFVPAGHEYHEWNEPRTSARLMHFYFDPSELQTGFASGIANTSIAPRLFFEDAGLLSTSLKLKRSVESQMPVNRLYVEALGVVLVHELMRRNRETPRIDAPTRGGLAPWQQRAVADYIEEHLAEQIPLAVLAQLVRLSPWYFCRAFKQSFGLPPHRYHLGRRVERAKELLARRTSSVTDIGLTLGFCETSSFSTTFRKATGLAPSQYCRSVAGIP
jgi:AraC family transcriptional regulator